MADVLVSVRGMVVGISRCDGLRLLVLLRHDCEHLQEGKMKLCRPVGMSGEEFRYLREQSHLLCISPLAG